MLNKMINMINGLEERDLNEGITANDINEFAHKKFGVNAGYAQQYLFNFARINKI